MITGICTTAVLLCVLYCAGVVCILYTLGTDCHERGDFRPSVSVVAAARNERESIAQCMVSLITQDYPSELYEIIIVDDRSSDGTAEIVESFAGGVSTVQLLKIKFVPKGISPKKNAVAHGIRHAKGEIILQTDADCIVPAGWISGVVGQFNPRTGAVLGIAPYLPSRGMLNSFVRHEYLWNAGLMAGSAALGMPTHASARNLAFRKRLFEDVGGYGADASLSSGDDTLFVHRIRKLSETDISVSCARETHVLTRSPQTFSAFVRQRIRHMSTGRKFRLAHLLVATPVYGFHLSFFVLAGLSLMSPIYMYTLLSVLAIKLATDAVAGERIARACGLSVQWRRFLINELLLVAYMAFMPIAGLFLSVVWKENDCETRHH